MLGQGAQRSCLPHRKSSSHAVLKVVVAAVAAAGEKAAVPKPATAEETGLNSALTASNCAFSQGN
jgi:hypothetical protein